MAESSDEVKVLCPGKNPDWPLSEIESTAFLLPSINFTFPPKIKECTNLEFSDSVLVFVLSPNFGTQMKPLAPESNHQNQKDNYKYSQRSVMWQTACAAFCSNSTRATPSLLLTYFSPATHLISHLRRNDTFSADRELTHPPSKAHFHFLR